MIAWMIIASVTSAPVAVLELPLLLLLLLLLLLPLLLLLLLLLLPVVVVVLVIVELGGSDARSSASMLSKSSSASLPTTSPFLPLPLLLSPSLIPLFLFGFGGILSKENNGGQKPRMDSGEQSRRR
jgi:hypothetical protein